MTRRITITVAAHACCGKSTVAELVRQALKAAGLNATLIDDNGCGIVDEEPGVIAATLSERLASVVQRDTQVAIKTKQLNRSGIHD